MSAKQAGQKSPVGGPSSIPLNGNAYQPPHEGRKPATPTQRSLGRLGLLAFLIIAASLAAIILFAAHESNEPLADSYALCSPDGPQIYTVDDTNARVECIVVHNSQVIDVGTRSDVRRRWAQNAHLLAHTDARPSLQIRHIPHGAMVVPGLSDSHAHMLEFGAFQQLPLEAAHDSKEAVQRVKNYIVDHPHILNDPTRFVEGWGWDHTAWPIQEFPSAAEFEADPVIRGRPIVLQSKDGHALWVSSRIMENMSHIPNSIEGGVIVRDECGQPTGVLLDNAQELVKKLPLTDEDLLIRFQATVNKALSAGLTSIHDAGFDPASLAFFKRRAQIGNLPIRIYAMSYFDENSEYNGDKIPKVVGEGHGRLTARSIKIFADGALRSGGAALHAPYADHPHTDGFMRIPPAKLRSVIPAYLRDGWQVNVHAIGDRANGIVLDAFEAALDGVNVTALRPRLEHAQMMTAEDIARLGKLGIIASIQPTHAISDMWYAEDRLGPERVKNLYAFRTLVDNGVRIALGSDAPVEDINPLAGFYAAVTRLSPEGRSPHGPGGWFPEQRLTRQEALRGMTIDPAYASFSESTLGSLEPGKYADYVILSQNIMAIPARHILSTKILATVIDGRPVYGRV